MKNERNNCINSVNLNADSDFPYLVLDVVGDQSYPRNPGFQVMHWHEDLQFIYVLDGEIEIKTLDTSVQVNKPSFMQSSPHRWVLAHPPHRCSPSSGAR